MKWKGSVLAATGVLFWGVAVTWGFSQGMKFETTPGRAATDYPVNIGKSAKWRFVLIASTDCPCSVATLSGLRAAVDSHPDSTVCEIVFIGEVNRNAPAYRIAGQIKNATIVEDKVGNVMRRYGAATSGQTFIYDPNGKLAYQGGLTAGRGVDDPRFAMEVYETVRTKNIKPYSPAYGCSLEGMTK